MIRGNWIFKLTGFVMLAALMYAPAGADENLLYPRHFEIALPKREVPKLVPVTLPEERLLRKSRPQKLLLPIEPDPVSQITPDFVE